MLKAERLTATPLFYKLKYNDRVIVEYQQGNYYFIVWYFNPSYDPLAGWMDKSNILLDKDVIP